MLTQEEYVQRVLELKRQGWSITEIAADVGYHPATVSKWLKEGGPPASRQVNPSERAIDDRWAARIDALIAPPSKLLATSVFEIIGAEGFTGSYPTVVRYVRSRRGPRFRVAPQVSVPIETGPGEEYQFDFSDCSVRARQFGLGDTLWCFGSVLCWSRHLFWWFTTSVDREHTMEGLVRHFEAVGGVPQVARTDRMGALGTSQGRRFALHPPTLDFCAHHGVEIKACQARDAKRKGKIERPFRGLEVSFLEELAVLGPPASVTELNARSQTWLAERVNGRAHSSTGAIPDERLATERRFFRPLPRRCYDTAYAEPRRVHLAVPLIHWKGVRYSVTPACIGQKVACREEVDAGELTITWAGRDVGRHRIAAAGSGDVWDPEHRTAAEAAALGHPASPAPRRRRSGASPARRPLRRLRRGRSRPRASLRSALMDGVYEQIKRDLDYLGWPRAAECFAPLADEAKAAGWNHVEYLAKVVAEQAAATVNRRLLARLRYARFPFRRTIDDFDFSFQPSVDKKLVEDLATLRFVDEHRPIVLLGQPGCGKTHLAVALAILAVEAGYRGYFTTADEMVRQLLSAQREGNFAAKLRTYTAPTVLVVDDVGLLPIGADGAGVFFNVINARYENGHPTLATTNRGLPAWGEVFGDPVVAGGQITANSVDHGTRASLIVHTSRVVGPRRYTVKSTRRPQGQPDAARDSVSGMTRAADANPTGEDGGTRDSRAARDVGLTAATDRGSPDRMDVSIHLESAPERAHEVYLNRIGPSRDGVAVH